MRVISTFPNWISIVLRSAKSALFRKYYLDPKLISTNVFLDLIECKQKQRGSFSFIRLGDGEGVLLSISDGSPDVDFEYLKMHLGPDNVNMKLLLSLQRRMREVVQGADVVGLRNDIVGVTFYPEYFDLPQKEFLQKFRHNFRLRECEKNLPYKGSRRIALLHKYMCEASMGAKVQYCSSWLHYDLHLTGGIFKLLVRQERVGLITSRRELGDKLAEIFDVEVDSWSIPDMYRDLDDDVSTNDYIEKLEGVLRKQLVKFPGMLFLVGGGFYGKLYCEHIRAQGGVALDVGSLLDAWVGIHSRPAVYKTLFSERYDGNDAPVELVLTVENVKKLTADDVRS